MPRTNTQPSQFVTQGAVTLKVYEVNRGTRKIFSVAHKENGRRQLKQFSDQVAAFDWAARRAKEIDRGHAKAVTLQPDEAAAYGRAKKILTGEGKGLDEVAKEYHEAVAILGPVGTLLEACRFYVRRHGTLQAKRVPEVVQELLSARAHKSERYARDLRLRLGKFAADMTGYIGNVTTHDISLWLKTRKGGDRNHDNFRRAIITLFRFAQRKGYLPEGRTEAEKSEARGPTNEGDIGVFQPEEIRRLLNVAKSDVRPYLALGAFAGIRTEEIKRLRWEEINLTTGYIEIKKSKAKTKGRRLIKMQPNLIVWLKLDWQRTGPVTPLAHPDRSAYDTTCRATKTADRSAVKWVRNGLRHSYCTYRFAQIQNEHIVASEMGNSPGMVFANYRALATKEQGKEWFSILPIKIYE
jgi:integrase